MGATWCVIYHEGADLEAAFRGAVNDAASEHGRGGYSRAIADKTGYVIITRRPVSRDEAQRLAGDLCERDDPRVADTWGPAGAIPVTEATAPGPDGSAGRLAVLRLGRN